jgi:hypothetical protein
MGPVQRTENGSLQTTTLCLARACLMPSLMPLRARTTTGVSTNPSAHACVIEASHGLKCLALASLQMQYKMPKRSAVLWTQHFTTTSSTSHKKWEEVVDHLVTHKAHSCHCTTHSIRANHSSKSVQDAFKNKNNVGQPLQQGQCPCQRSSI